MNDDMKLEWHEDFQTVQTIGEVTSYGIDLGSNCTPQINNNICWTYSCSKSAREQVQEEILTKMAEAIEGDDLKKARELVKLAKP